MSIINIQVESAEDAERYLAIASVRFETLVSPYTEEPYLRMFSFDGNASGSRVTINLGHLRWEPDDQETWRSVR